MATNRKTFTWLPEFESQLSEEPKVNVTKFGDGYEQRVAVGINNRAQKWTLQFTMADPDLADIVTFIRARNGLESFYWTTPMGDSITVVCRSWKSTRKQGHYVLNVEFEQVFEA